MFVFVQSQLFLSQGELEMIKKITGNKLRISRKRYRKPQIQYVENDDPVVENLKQDEIEKVREKKKLFFQKILDD